MVDWQYGNYNLLFWVLTIVCLFPMTLIKDWQLSIGYVIVVIAVLWASSAWFERRHPKYQQRNRTTTISHIRGYSATVCVIILIGIMVLDENAYQGAQFLLVFTLVGIPNIVAAYFSKLINSFDNE
ncbi:hypothetical protein [Secundilactobacillus odoratitofui]|nr:hypothetical protein [Secundilactobacillus odoratitofui]